MSDSSLLEPKEYIPGLDHNENITEDNHEQNVTSYEVAAEAEEPIASNKNKSHVIKNEFIIIENKDKVLPYVTSQTPKTNHFMFKNIKDQENLGSVLAPKDSGFTAVFSTTRDKPHITLTRGNKIEGKIHFLYYDKNKSDNKYIKLYLFDFTDNEVHSDIKNKLKSFFENFTPANSSVSQQQQGGKKKRSALYSAKRRRAVTKGRRHAKRKTNKRR
jgi:hypothetical protein